MDAKIAVEILRDMTIDFSPRIPDIKPMSMRRCKEIADFIEQQAKRIEDLEKNDIHREFCIVEMGQKIAEYEHDELAYVLIRYHEQAKYTELAKQAIAELEKYPCRGIVTDECKPKNEFILVCDNYWFCRLRAELLAEVKP